MNTQVLIELFERDLTRLKKELLLYKKEEMIWLVKSEINNSAGNLALHIIGNLKTFVGTNLGGTGYIRNREAEFSEKNIPRTKILKMIDETFKVIQSTVINLTENDLNKLYPVQVFKNKKEMTNEYFLIHLYGHFNYHLGQINYHRRLIQNNE